MKIASTDAAGRDPEQCVGCGFDCWFRVIFDFHSFDAGIADRFHCTLHF